jgi:hypothetical protein
VTAVADRLGHQGSTETLKTYPHLWEDDEERALSVIDSALSSLVSGGYENSEQPHSSRLAIVAGHAAYQQDPAYRADSSRVTALQ